jgi:RimJ/RimL family protein N-acetyltransferase
MQREGVFRKHRLHRWEYADEIVYGILRDEWPGAGTPNS